MKKISLLLLIVFTVAGAHAQSALNTDGLDKYTGVYSSSSVPLKFTISKEGNTLMMRGTGQKTLTLQPAGKDTYKCDSVGLVITFDPVKRTFVLKQSGQTFLYLRDKIQKPEPTVIEDKD
jgi:D-alanyl-D-alanine carboxypeptidase